MDSIGGDFDEALQIYTMLREHPATKKRAVVVRDCQSAAMLPFLACDLRTAYPSARLLIHGCSINPLHYRDRRWSSEDLQEAARQTLASDEIIADILVERTGFDRKWFVDEMTTDSVMKLTDALKAGIIHEIAGVTRSPSEDWPDHLAAQRNFVVGLPSYLFSENYLNACKAALPNTAQH